MGESPTALLSRANSQRSAQHQRLKEMPEDTVTKTYGLRPKVLNSVLREALETAGVEMSMLMQNDGSLIAVAAEDPSKTKKIAAIVSNIWSSYDKVAIQALQCVVLENEDSRLAVMALGGNSEALVCIVAEPTLPFGLLKALVVGLVEHLKEPIALISPHLK